MVAAEAAVRARAASGVGAREDRRRARIRMEAERERRVAEQRASGGRGERRQEDVVRAGRLEGIRARDGGHADSALETLVVRLEVVVADAPVLDRASLGEDRGAVPLERLGAQAE